MSTISILIVLIFLSKYEARYLSLQDEYGKPYFEIKVKKNEEFYVSFIHSVNKTPVIDYYEIRDDGIYVIKTKYYSFGAGVQTKVSDEEKLSYDEDGGMIVSGFNKKISDLSYVVGKVSDHILGISGLEYSLIEVAGKGAYVEFKQEKKNILEEVRDFVKR